MCGRFVTASSPDDLANYFGALTPDQELDGDVDDDHRRAAAPEGAPDGDPRAGAGDGIGDYVGDYNVAPTKEVYVVRAKDDHRYLSTMRWGLVPFWAKDLKIGARMINARVETVADKPAFRKAYRARRCLIPADGFYEWAKIPGQKRKQPYFIHRADGEPVVFAGLWERWQPRLPDSDERDESADTIESFTILTGSPNREMATIHDRMPVMIPASSWDLWLHAETDPARVSELLRPPPDDFLVLRPISTAVNNVRNNGPQLLDEIEPATGTGAEHDGRPVDGGGNESR